MKIHSFWGAAGRRSIFTDVSNRSDVLTFRASRRVTAVRTANSLGKIIAHSIKNGTCTYFCLIIIKHFCVIILKHLLLCNYTKALTSA